MKKPRKDHSELSRSQRRRLDDIIQASLKIFDRDGFDKARLSDIADEAGMAKGTLYLYFDSKTDLFEGVIQKAILTNLEVLANTAQTHQGTAKELLISQLKIGAKRMQSPEMKTLLRYMISGKAKNKKVISFYYEKVIQPGIKIFKQTLKQGVVTGEFKKEVADIDPLVLFGAQIYVVVWKILFEDRSSIDAERLGDDLIRLCMNGLLTG